ncbi:MAG: DUF2029 domain-containing protein [Chloroflexi bacterium]|nr:DUF2029 domain-containing protein [Chloroflexota bacterium]MCC6897000.1 DUF2029 domain-containing protein [Anaerolineae bacterium]
MAKGKGSSAPLQLHAILGDFQLLLILFISLRVLLLLVFQPFLLQGVERGITAGGDFQTYFQIASLSDSAGMPLRDWWSEFPPLWSYFSVIVYKLQPNFTGFSMLLGIVFLVFDIGNLVLIRKIASQVYSAETGQALAWVYALLLAPLVFVFWTFEVVVAFFMLLSVWWLLRERDLLAGIGIAIGTLVKFTPLVLLGSMWRYRKTRQAILPTVVSVGIVAAVYAVFFLQNAAMTMPSLTAQFSKASYQTVWALIDGNYRTGNFGPLEDRLDPQRATIVQGNPAVIPGWLRLAAGVVIGVFVFVRTRRFDAKGLLAFAGISLLIFFLQAQGWSPQWLVQIIPFILLCFPTRDGVILVVLLSLVTFVEYPFLFIRTGDTGGEITGSLVTPFATLVVARTVILAGICVGLYRILRQSRDRQGLVT